MTDGKVTLTGDTSGLVQSAERAEKAVRKIGKAAQDTGTQQKSATDAIGQGLEGLGKSLLLVEGLRRAAAAYAKNMEEVRQSAARTSEETGSTSLDMAQALARTGLTPEQQIPIMAQAGAGARPREETSAFVAQMATQQGRRLRPDRALELTRAFASGVVSPEEIQQRMERGRTFTSGEIQQRREALPPEAKRELRIREELRLAEELRRQQTGGRDAVRLIDLERERRRRESPVLQSFQDLFPDFMQNDIIEQQQEERLFPGQRNAPGDASLGEFFDRMTARFGMVPNAVGQAVRGAVIETAPPTRLSTVKSE